MRETIYKLIFDQYSVEPEFPWGDAPDACVFRHYDNRKWFALMMEVRPSSLGLSGTKRVLVMNVKIIPEDLYDLLQVPGILPAYHMNKQHWVTLRLDGTLNLQAIQKLLNASYELTKRKIRSR